MSARGRTQPTRPLMPKLASSQGNGRTGPAPRLAGYGSPIVAAGQTVGQSSNGSKGTANEPRPTSYNPVNIAGSANVTPRSGSRQDRANRFDSPYSTPTTPSSSTPTTRRPVSTMGLQPLVKSSLGQPSPPISGRLLENRSTRPMSMIDGRQASPIHSVAGLASPGSEGYFFRADALPSKENAARPPLRSKTSSFLYASGEEAEGLPSQPGDSNMTARPTIHGAAVSPSAQQIRPTSLQSFSPTYSRPLSPLKDDSNYPFIKDTPHIVRPTSFINLSPPLRASTSSPLSQTKGSSVVSLDSGRSAASPALAAVANMPLEPTSPVSVNGERRRHSATGQAWLQSPSSSEDPGLSSATSSAGDVGSKQSSATTLAVEARRERKVLDLEISNSSLLAINRSLEREVQRQKSELRRFHRLSRSNRLSWLSDATSESDGQLLLGSTHGDGEALDDDNDVRSDGDSALGLDAQRESDASHRKSDQRLLRLDLSKHKELIVDSQKLNQSLARCLSLTDQLVKDANRALEYRVTPTQVRLGGRVLAQDDVDSDALADETGAFTVHGDIDGASYLSVEEVISAFPTPRSSSPFSAEPSKSSDGAVDASSSDITHSSSTLSVQIPPLRGMSPQRSPAPSPQRSFSKSLPEVMAEMF
ncbi:hypothetical protein MRB53_037582 [Persea americana]|nr:hypothetical protein MRB53_037582 [Persea americana]